MKKLRRRGVDNLGTANQFLATECWAPHNARFAQAPASPDDYHIRTLASRILGRV